MHATADSKMVRIRGAISNAREPSALVAINAFPSKDIKRCPAIKLAVNRTHNVIGRIRFLVISISTMNDIKAGGVPCGTKCLSM